MLPTRLEPRRAPPGGLTIPTTNQAGSPSPNTAIYAESSDGLHFVSDRTYLAESYLRTFSWDGWKYGFSGGFHRRLSRSRDLRTPFAPSPVLDIDGEAFTDFSTYDKDAPNAAPPYRTRHIAFHRRGHELDIFYSNVGDRPERIKCTTVDLRPDWTEWQGTQYKEVLRSETDYEGVAEPITHSLNGSVHKPMHQLRDPYVYEEDGTLYLFYSVAGEHGIGMAKIHTSSSFPK